VKNWQVGNETYGPYQEGHTDAQDFAQRFVNHYQAMKEVDPDIKIIASGIDPLYVDYDENWNKTLFQIAGNNVDGVDIHRYVRGIVDDSKRNGWDPDIYMRNLVNFATMYEEHVIKEVRQSANERGVNDILINVGEWNLQPIVSSGWDRADYPTMAHAAFVAGMFNAFTRQGDAVQYSYQRDNTLFYRPFPIDTRPVNPGNYVSKYYAEPFTHDMDWHQVDLSSDSPTFFAEAAGIRQKDTPNVPYVDASAIRSENGDKLYVFVTNRSLQDAYDLNVSVHEDWEIQSAHQVMLSSTDPFREQTSWTSRNGFSLDSGAVQMNENATTVTMAAASVVRLEMDVENTVTSIADGDSDLPRKVGLGQNYPNPFNPTTTIPYTLPSATNVKIEVFNVMGQRVTTLLDRRQQAGHHSVSWNAENMSSGVYYYKLTTGGETRIQSMTLVK
jgi:alpha-N-arabinofuranosidase